MKHIKDFDSFAINESFPFMEVSYSILLASGLIYGYNLVSELIDKAKFLYAKSKVNDITEKIERDHELERLFDKLADIISAPGFTKTSPEFIKLSNEIWNKLLLKLTPDELYRWKKFTKKHMNEYL
jgi:hypothetical protein